MIRLGVITLLFLSVTACSSLSGKSNSINMSQEALLICINKIEDLGGGKLSEEVDNIYVDVFSKGYTLSFSSGAIGSFGKRSPDSKTVWACAVTENRVVYLGAPLKDALIDEPGSDSLEDYSENVIEVRFKRDNGSFKYCCSQPFDEKNIEKNNPGFPWKTDRVS